MNKNELKLRNSSGIQLQLRHGLSRMDLDLQRPKNETVRMINTPLLSQYLLLEITCTGDMFIYRSLFVSSYTSAIQTAEDVSARRVQLNRTEQVS